MKGHDGTFEMTPNISSLNWFKKVISTWEMMNWFKIGNFLLVSNCYILGSTWDRELQFGVGGFFNGSFMLSEFHENRRRWGKWMCWFDMEWLSVYASYISIEINSLELGEWTVRMVIRWVIYFAATAVVGKYCVSSSTGVGGLTQLHYIRWRWPRRITWSPRPL